VRRIVYTDGGDVWQITGPNPPVQLSSSGQAVDVKISDDGERVVFVRHDPSSNVYEIRGVNADGSGEMILLDQAALDSLHPLDGALHIGPNQLHFLPGSHDLLLNTQGVFEGPGLALYEDLLQVNTETGTVTELLPPEEGGAFHISPDGTQIALVRPTSLSLINADGTHRRDNLVTFPTIITYSEFLYHPPAVWSPHSGAVGIVIPSEDPLATATSGTVWRVPAAGGSASSLATIPGSFYFPQMSGGALISPDLSKVAFLRETSPNLYDLYYANADGSGEAVYDSGNIQWKGWAPESTHFVYAKEATNLILGRIGNPPLSLASGTNLRWITDNRYLYLSGSAGSWTLMRGELGAGDSPLVSPVGDFIAFDVN
jgi:Tol biopolymer transport system component